MQEKAEKIALSIADAAAAIGVSASMFRGLVNQNEVPHIRVGGRILIPRAALEAYIDGKLSETEALRRAGQCQRAQQALEAGAKAA